MYTGRRQSPKCDGCLVEILLDLVGMIELGASAPEGIEHVGECICLVGLGRAAPIPVSLPGTECARRVEESR